MTTPAIETEVVPLDDPAADSLAEAFEAAEAYALLSEALEPVDGGDSEPLQSASD